MAKANFASALLGSREKFYNDHNVDDLIIVANGQPGPDQPPDMSRGQVPRDWKNAPHGSAWPRAQTIPQSNLIPRENWDDLIEEREAKGLNLSQLMLAAGLPCKDQNGTNYCWINAPTHCAEIVLTKANQFDPETGKPWDLSPASVGCKVKGFRNQGGWGGEGLEYMIPHGVVPSKYWPPNAISKQYDTAENWEHAAKLRVDQWFDIRERNFDECASCWLRGIPTADGHNWWSHEVTGYDLVKMEASIINKSIRDFRNMLKRKSIVMPQVELDQRLELMASKYGCRKRNSWSMTYGEKGFFILGESKATPDDSCAPTALLPA